MTVEPAVLPLVVRAGGGSARDSLSILDQLLAGAGPDGITYAQAVGLLGVTDGALLDDMVDALAAGDAAAVYGTIDRVVEAGHDPRRFAADLLDRFRDLILLDAVPDAGERGLIDAPQDEVTHMADQALRLGGAPRDALRRDRAHRADRDARNDLAAAGARVAVRPDAVARRGHGFGGAAAAPRTARAALLGCIVRRPRAWPGRRTSRVCRAAHRSDGDQRAARCKGRPGQGGARADGEGAACTRLRLLPHRSPSRRARRRRRLPRFRRHLRRSRWPHRPVRRANSTLPPCDGSGPRCSTSSSNPAGAPARCSTTRR